MSETTKTLPSGDVGEAGNIIVLSTRLSNKMKINDFVAVENPEDRSKDREVSENSNTSGNVVQCDNNSETREEILPLCDSDDIEICNITTDMCDREFLDEKCYWDLHGLAVPKTNNGKFKKPISQRNSLKLHNIIAAKKPIPRDPSYFKLDRATTALLDKLIKEGYIGRLHNVVGRGSNSVVIHADCPYASRVIHISRSSGNAVKIHKLSTDSKKNIAILKRTQREYDHLLRLNRHSGSTPYVVHKKRNIIIMLFDGFDQETAASISDLPAEYSKEMYQVFVSEMYIWYNKANLVHGRLSIKKSFHTIYTDWRGVVRCVLIVLGWSHSVPTDHPEALRKLMRDCIFVTNFFNSRNVADVKSAEDLFKHITGLDSISNRVLEVLNGKNLWHARQLDNPNRVHRDKGTTGNSRFK